MDESSAFTKRHIEEVTTAKQTLLEELNLPTEVIAFLRANKVLLWGVFLLIIAGICGYRYYNYYTAKMQDNGAYALAQAMAIPDVASREAALRKVGDEYSSTGSAQVSKFALAHDLATDKKYDEAIAILMGIYPKMASDDAGYPLLLNDLGQLHEQQGDLAKALGFYEKLIATPGFHSFGYIAAARVYEKMTNNDKAREMYENANTDTSLQPAIKSWLEAKIATL